jgi:hypothetical protein
VGTRRKIPTGGARQHCKKCANLAASAPSTRWVRQRTCQISFENRMRLRSGPYALFISSIYYGVLIFFTIAFSAILLVYARSTAPGAGARLQTSSRLRT